MATTKQAEVIKNPWQRLVVLHVLLSSVPILCHPSIHFSPYTYQQKFRICFHVRTDSESGKHPNKTNRFRPNRRKCQTRASTSYFTLPSLPWMLNILGWFYALVGGTAFIPHLVPFEYFGPGGTCMRLMHTYFPNFAISVFVPGTFAHFLEALYSWRLCGSIGIKGGAKIKWFLSTTIFGGASLYELVTFQSQPDVHAD
ncbi:transmembrane protein 254-like isoform X1 [Acanthaster planci]|uniref:Transmembrane protein 254 n=1 Tax=Acanthaster planci TaxID=133434 RepID=A0A8B7YZ24_ACAPL|nr:transmembrane protein 254-like isoform X1 [Acanthaster planci]